MGERSEGNKAVANAAPGQSQNNLKQHIKNMKKTLAFALSALAATAAFAQVPENVAAARKDAEAALKSYNDGAQTFLGAKTVMDGRAAQINEISTGVFSLQTSFAENENWLENYAKQAEAFDLGFEANISALDAAQKNLNAFTKSFPLGEDRIQKARETISAVSDMVAKNPGSNNEDRYYFNAVRSNFESAVSFFQSLQNQADKLSVMAAVISPRIEGIRDTRKMTAQYMEKIGELHSANKSGISALAESSAGFSKNYAQTYAQMKEKSVAIHVCRAKVISALEAVTVFEMNKVSSDIVFKRTSPLEIVSIAMPAPLAKPEPVPPMAFKGNAKAASWNKPQVYTADADARAGTLGARENTAPTAREEILSSVYYIENITAQINEASKLLGWVVNDMNLAISLISQNENESQSTLRNVINMLGSSQSLASEIQILKVKCDIVSAQEKISATELEKLFKSSEALIEKAGELAGSAEEKIASEN